MAGVTRKPFYLVSYSLGGVITRQVIMNLADQGMINNFKGILFVSCPLNGSDMRV